MIGLKDAKTSLNTHIDSAGNTAIDLGYIGKAIENVECPTNAVAAIADLPDATTHKGIFFHVTDLDEYFWSDGVEWTNEKSSVYNVSLWTWGHNVFGQLGDNTTVSKKSPVTTAGGGTNWNNIAAGNEHILATKRDGTLWTWGRNLYGQLGDNTPNNNHRGWYHLGQICRRKLSFHSHQNRWNIMDLGLQSLWSTRR
jgi:hypothetical protein